MVLSSLGLGRKVTATLIMVSLLSVIISTLLMLVMTRQQFSNYINQNNQVIVNQWSPLIIDYYLQLHPSTFPVSDLLERLTPVQWLCKQIKLISGLI